MIKKKIYIKGSLAEPETKPKRGAKQKHRHFTHPEDKPYYYDDGDWYSAVDDLKARGYRLGDGRFLPEDYDDLIGFEEARRLCRKAGLTLHQPKNPTSGRLAPPPLFYIRGPKRSRPAWNRSTILRHIDTHLKEKRNG